MKQPDHPIRLGLVAATLLLSSSATGPVFAQAIGPSNFDAAVPCDAFRSSANGGWTAVAPVTLRIDNGMSVSFAPGDSMAPGSTINGVAVPVIITRRSGNM